MARTILPIDKSRCDNQKYKAEYLYYLKRMSSKSYSEADTIKIVMLIIVITVCLMVMI